MVFCDDDTPVLLRRIEQESQCFTDYQDKDLPTPSSSDIDSLPDSVILLQKEVWSLLEANDRNVRVVGKRIDLPFEMVFRRPTLLSRQYPVGFDLEGLLLWYSIFLKLAKE
uniref:Reverse transcriptase n=1 Tax=Ascaris lumbricoides TaxID=6252 RepID=A0A0M3HWA9_ASCLU